MTDTVQLEEDVGAVFRELREYGRGVMDVDHSDVHPVAGLIKDDEVRNTLVWMAENYDHTDHPDLPRDFWDTGLARRAIRKHATKTATKAIEEGNATQAAYLTGLPSYRSDVSGLHAINQLTDWLVHSEQCKLIYLAALMGRGKTDLSLTLLEVVYDHYTRLERSTDAEIPTVEFATNFHAETPREVDAEIREIHHYEELLEWAERGSSDDERWFIFDEASTELTAQSGSNSQKVAETMGPFVKKMRKMGINMVVIGHDSGDVHVAIRSLADYVDKVGLKTASFYSGVNKREGVGHLFDLEGIPETSWTFDTDDTADWCWCEEDAPECPHAAGTIDDDPGLTEKEFKREVAERGARLWLQTPDDVTQGDIADALSTPDLSVSASNISRKAKRIRNDTSSTVAEANA